MATIELRITELKEPDYIWIHSEGKSPFGFKLTSTHEESGNGTVYVVFEIDANVNAMMSMMVKRPLENLLEVIAGGNCPT